MTAEYEARAGSELGPEWARWLAIGERTRGASLWAPHTIITYAAGRLGLRPDLPRVREKLRLIVSAPARKPSTGSIPAVIRRFTSLRIRGLADITSREGFPVPRERQHRACRGAPDRLPLPIFGRMFSIFRGVPLMTTLRLLPRVGLYLLCIALFFTLADGQERGAKAPAQGQSQAVPQKIHAITNAALKSGVNACAGRIEQVANFLTADSQSSAVLFLPPSLPDQRLVSTSIEVENKNGPLAYASASFAPGMANGCGGMYETVVYWSASCDQVAMRSFSKLKRIGVISRSIVILDGGISTRIFLMPAGVGCVSIKKEVVL